MYFIKLVALNKSIFKIKKQTIMNNIIIVK